MTARTPEDVDREFAAALNRADLEALVALYEPDATLTPPGGKTVTGHAAIREGLAGFVAMKPRFAMEPRLVAQAGDVALVYGKWQFDGTTPDGQAMQLKGQSVEVMRRQRDGSWRMIIDEPLGVQP